MLAFNTSRFGSDVPKSKKEVILWYDGIAHVEEQQGEII